MSDHLSLDDIAELDEGLLPPDRISTVRAHLHGCDQCQARAKALETTRSALSDLPPVVMPANVTARLDNAIAAAGETRTTASSEPDDEEKVGLSNDVSAPDDATASDDSVRSVTIAPHVTTVSRPRFGRPTMAASAVAAALILAVGAIVIGHLHHSSTPATTAGPSSSAAGKSVIAAAPTRDFTITSTGRTYSGTTISSQVNSLIAPTSAAAKVPAAATPSTGTTSGSTATGTTAISGEVTTRTGPNAAAKADSLERQPVAHALVPLSRSHAKQLACAARLDGGDSNAVPLTIDFGRWTGPGHHASPAAIFVFNGVAPSTLAVFVVNPTCTGNDLLYNYTQVNTSG